MSKKQKGVNPELEKAINQMLSSVMSDPMSTLMDKCRVMDRAINEGSLGGWQVDIGGTTYILGYFLVDDKEKPDYLQYATLGLFYDLYYGKKCANI